VSPRAGFNGCKKSGILYGERLARSESFYKQADTPTNVKDHTSSWEANSRTVSQENPHRLRNQNIHCRVHNGLPFFSHPASYTQCAPSHPISLWYILILFSYLHSGLPSGLFHIFRLHFLRISGLSHMRYMTCQHKYLVKSINF